MIMRPCEAKITQPCIHLTVKKDVASLNIPVDDNLFPVLVEVEETRCNPFDDVEPLRPTQIGAAMILSMQVAVKASIGQYSRAPEGAVACACSSQSTEQDYGAGGGQG